MNTKKSSAVVLIEQAGSPDVLIHQTVTLPDLNIDPIYGARAWSVMTDFSNGPYKSEDIVYWHCGYTPDWEISLQK